MFDFLPICRSVGARAVVVTLSLILMASPQFPPSDAGGTEASDRSQATCTSHKDLLAFTPSKSSFYGDSRNQDCFQPFASLASSHHTVQLHWQAHICADHLSAFNITLDRCDKLCRWLI